jgi:hypothetical protein
MNKLQINTINGGFIKNSMIYQKNNPLIKNITGYKKENHTLGTFKNKIDYVKKKNNGLGVNGTLGTLEKENDSIKGTLGNLKKENDSIKGTLGNLKKENNGLVVNGTLGNLKKKNDSIKGTLGNLKKENNGLVVNGALGNLKKKNDSIKGTLGNLKKENNGLVVNGDMDGFGKEKGDMSPKFVYLYKQKFEMEAVNNKLDMDGLSPVSEYEPTYNPNYWNNNKNIKNNNNCYSYSVNNKNHKFGKPQPGYFARFNHIKNNQYKCAYFFKRILNDIPSVYLTSFKQKCKKGFTKAFFAIDSNKNEHDYHFYRQDKNQLWSHKPGTTNVINYDADYKIIKNPYKANRNYSTYNYDKPCFFFCVNNKFGKTKAKN